MQTDGNFVLYNGLPFPSGSPSGSPYWATNTAGPTGVYTTIIQADGNLVVYGGIPSGNPGNPGVPASWASNTANWPPPTPEPDPSWWS
jgi:hypothetical protein